MSDEVVDTSFGKFLINPNDCIGSTLKAGTVWDGPGFLQVAAQEFVLGVNHGKTVLDIGANIGVWTVWLCRMGVYRVVACEPIPETRRYLKANLDLNKEVCASRVVVIETAAYDRACQMHLDRPYDPDNMGASALVPLEPRMSLEMIEAAPLDRYLPFFGRNVGLIKLDIQGCEMAALHGLWETIRRDHPAIVFEAETKEAVREIWTWLEGQRYTVDPWPSQPNNFLATWKG